MNRIDEIEKDIKELTIQGATNVAISTVEGMKYFLEHNDINDIDGIYAEAISIGNRLANARPNEPLARNAVIYVKYFYQRRKSDLQDKESMKQLLEDLCDQFLDMIDNSKREILRYGVPELKYLNNLLTHCHSSTAVSMLKGVGEGKSDYGVVCTETRPLYQGRITAKSLLDAGIQTIMIADSCAESFVIGRGASQIDAVVMGCDQITLKGNCINKIGSWGIAMSSYFAGKPVYIISPLLKVCPKKEYILIEVREDRELWHDAPEGLDLYNPAFELIDRQLITAYITEFGLVKPSEIENILKEKYPWIFEE